MFGESRVSRTRQTLPNRIFGRGDRRVCGPWVGEVAEEGCPYPKDRGIRRSGHVVPYGYVVFRMCTKTGCSEHAAATLTYEYQNSQVWIDGLTPEREPHSYDLCRDHARRLTAPRGWDVVDRRIQQLGWRVAV